MRPVTCPRRRIAITASLLLLQACACLRVATATEQLPHIDECSLCFNCVVDSQPKPFSHKDLVVENFAPPNVHGKQRKPLCQRCRGCTVDLQPLIRSGKKNFLNRTFVDEAGASPNWLFVAPTDKTASGKAIVKIACVPVGKDAHAKGKCFPELAVKFARIYLALAQIVEECGLSDIVPKVWVEWVSAIIPEVGYHVRWLSTWMEVAEGISFENLVRLGQPAMHPQQMLDFLHTKINGTQVVLAAIFDLLTSQADRHAQNLFMDETGRITLIDNERAFYHDQVYAADSMLLPTTRKFMIHVIENAWINKFSDWPADKVPQCWSNPGLLFDYRCYVPGGNIGKNYPPKVAQCLEKVSKLTVQQVHEAYDFPSLVTAEAFKNRSQAMWERGFEYALTEGYPRNPNPWRYKFAAPCCKIKHTDTYRCAHEWPCDTSIPLGDPIGGLPWNRDYKDPGTYEGGSVF